MNRISSVVARGQNPYRPARNFASDSTVDEFYFFRMWDRQTETAATNLWGQGRYHLPRTQTEGQYVSPTFGITVTGVSRTLPQGSAASPPGPPPVPPTPGGTVGADRIQARLLGVSWTWFAEMNEQSPEYAPLLVDYSAAMQGTRAYLRPKLEISFEADGTWLPPLADEGYSAILDASGAPVQVLDPRTLRWKANFRWDTSVPVGAILLATPVLDDLTIYYDGGDTGLSSYYVN